MTQLETAKARTLKEIGPILSATFLASMSNASHSFFGWRRDRLVRNYAGADSEKAAECNEFIDWCLEDYKRLQVFIATRSPSTAAELSIRYSQRLCPDAEKIVVDKAKDKPKLLEYCGRWGILLGDMSKVTMRAAFAEDATREKAYIRKLEHTKKKIKEFLEQMVGIGQLDSGTTVKELIETF